MERQGSDGRVAAAISVVVPFYNLERYVRPCLDSVAAAFRALSADGRPSVEVVCVDDGSTDSTGEFLDAYARDLPRSGLDGFAVRVVHQSNGGEGAARNAGVAASTGEWVTFLDGDDIWLDNHLKVAAPLLARFREADIVALKYEGFEDGAAPPKPTSAEAREFDVSASIPSEVLLEVGVFPTFFRRDFAVTCGNQRLFQGFCVGGHIAVGILRSDAAKKLQRLGVVSQPCCMNLGCSVKSVIG